MQPRAIPSDTYFMLGALGIGILSFLRLRKLLTGEGRTWPNSTLTYVLLLRPFRSARRDLFSHMWVAPALWQFGQPIFPVDVNSDMWKEKVGYVLPKHPSWKRCAFGFDRLLHFADWEEEIKELAVHSCLVIVDISIVTSNILTELSIVERQGALRRTVCVFDQNGDPAQRQCSSTSVNADISSVISNAIPYSLDHEDALRSFWEQIVERATIILGWDKDVVPHPVAPKRLVLNVQQLIQVLARGSISPIAH